MRRDGRLNPRCSCLCLVGVLILLVAGGCRFDPDIEPLIFPTAPPQPFSNYAPGVEEIADLKTSDAEQYAPGDLQNDPDSSRGALRFGAFAFTAAISLMVLAGIRLGRLGPCVVDGLLTLANGVGTLLLLTEVAIPIAIILLLVNAAAQFFQFLTDNEAFRAGTISREHYYFNIGLDIADAIPGLGVLSGIFGLMGTCVFDWAFEFGPNSPDRR